MQNAARGLDSDVYAGPCAGGNIRGVAAGRQHPVAAGRQHPVAACEIAVPMRAAHQHCTGTRKPLAHGALAPSATTDSGLSVLRRSSCTHCSSHARSGLEPLLSMYSR